MAVPISQAWTVATYVLKQKAKGRKRFPLVTMLEPLFRCNLACAGCGKIQYPPHILKQELMPEDIDRYLSGKQGTPGGSSAADHGYTEQPLPAKQRLLASRLLRGASGAGLWRGG